MDTTREFILLFALLVVAPAATAGDSPVERAAAADRYLRLYPVTNMVSDTVASAAEGLPKETQARFVSFMGATINAAELEVQFRQALVKVFTVEELDAMTRFYGSPAGMRVKRKMPLYMKEMTAVIQQIMRRAAYQASTVPKTLPRAIAQPRH